MQSPGHTNGAGALETSPADHARPYPKAVRRIHVPAHEVERGDLVSDEGRLRVVILDPIPDDLMGVKMLRIRFGDGGGMPALPGGLVTVYRLEY